MKLNSIFASYFSIAVVVGAVAVSTTLALAANPFNIKFPIAELGNCKSLDDCRIYCDNPSNTNACLDYAQKQGLVNQDEAQQAKNFQDSLSKGDVPVSGCTDENSCRQLCGQPENAQQCIAWAEKHGLSPNNQNQPGQNVNQQGPNQQPPNNQNINNPNPGPNINKEKAAQAIKEHGGPGGCANFEECGNFCSQPNNQKTCLDYAQKYGLMSQQDVQKAQKFVSKPGPGGCFGEQCRIYCSDPSHQEECTKFAVDNGFMTQEQADQMKQQMEKAKNINQTLQTFGGPGGCKSDNECRQYCSDPAHVQECNSFAEKSGLINPEDAQRNIKQFNNEINNIDPSFNTQNIPSAPRMEPPQNFSGPGNCQNPEDCIRYCISPNHQAECSQFIQTRPQPQQQPPQNNQQPNQSFQPQPYQSGMPYPQQPEMPNQPYPQQSGQPYQPSQPGMPYTQPNQTNQQPPGSPMNYPQETFTPTGGSTPYNYQPPSSGETVPVQQTPTGGSTAPPGGSQLPLPPPPPPPSGTSQPTSFLRSFEAMISETLKILR